MAGVRDGADPECFGSAGLLLSNAVRGKRKAGDHLALLASSQGESACTTSDARD